MQIKVTKKHIREGKPEDCRRCPIAHAVAAALKLNERTEYYVWVASGIEVIVSDGEGGLKESVFRLAEKARKFMEDFDQLRPVKPFTFRLVKDL